MKNKLLIALCLSNVNFIQTRMDNLAQQELSNAKRELSPLEAREKLKQDLICFIVLETIAGAQYIKNNAHYFSLFEQNIANIFLFDNNLCEKLKCTEFRNNHSKHFNNFVEFVNLAYTENAKLNFYNDQEEEKIRTNMKNDEIFFSHHFRTLTQQANISQRDFSKLQLEIRNDFLTMLPTQSNNDYDRKLYFALLNIKFDECLETIQEWTTDNF